MIHAFLLVVLLGDIEQRNQPMYFRNINECNYFASKLVKRYGNYTDYGLVPKKHKATAYCKLVYIDEKTPGLY